MAVIGLVGVGGYGGTILRAAMAAENVTLAALLDANADAAARAAAQSGARVVSSLEEMLKDDAIEGVALVVPNPLHLTMLEQVVNAGKHAYIEKPIANTVAEGLRIVEAANGAGRVLMVGHNTRRAGGFRKAREIIESGEMGRLVAMEANFSHSGGLGVGPQSWRYRRESCPAVPLLQLGIHCVDTMHYFVGPTRRVASFMRASAMKENEDTTVTLLELDGGILATLHSHYVVPGTNFINVYGTDANLHIEWTRLEKTIRRPYGTTSIPVDEINTQAEEMAEFARCIETGQRPETDGDGAVLALAVVEAAILSAQRDAPVTISEVMDRARQ